MNTEKDDTLKGLDQTLTSVENELLTRKVDRDDETIDTMVGFVNDIADKGMIDIKDDTDPPDEDGGNDDDVTPPDPSDDGDDGDNGDGDDLGGDDSDDD